jgi:hypothetical protein
LPRQMAEDIRICLEGRILQTAAVRLPFLRDGFQILH